MGQITAHPEAIAELREGIRYYEEKSSGLGRHFFEEINERIRHITEGPTRFSERLPGVRRANLKRFPFHIYYLWENESVAIVAFAHDKRRPLYWKGRLDPQEPQTKWTKIP